jgi:hypothetical protein
VVNVKFDTGDKVNITLSYEGIESFIYALTKDKDHIVSAELSYLKNSEIKLINLLDFI